MTIRFEIQSGYGEEIKITSKVTKVILIEDTKQIILERTFDSSGNQSTNWDLKEVKL